MEQLPNRANPVDARAMVPPSHDPRLGVEKRSAQESSRSKRSEELVTSDHQFFGIDRNLAITVAVVGVSLCLSLYLFKEVKKLRDDVRTIKSQEPDEELAQQVEENRESVKAIETKLDQLITALGARERRFQQMQQQVPQQQVPQQQVPQQQVPQQMMQPQHQVPQQMMQPQQQVPQQMMMQPQQPPQQMMMSQPPQVTEQEYQNQQIMQQQMAQQMAQQQQAEQQMTQHSQQAPVMGGRIAGSAVTMDDPGIIRI
jgi:hypothetical protein